MKRYYKYRREDEYKYLIFLIKTYRFIFLKLFLEILAQMIDKT